MSDAAALMDSMYRRQRHIYDASRKFYLLGRDAAISRLRPARGGCDRVRCAGAIRVRKFRACDDLIRPVDDSAMAQSASASA